MHFCHISLVSCFVTELSNEAVAGPLQEVFQNCSCEAIAWPRCVAPGIGKLPFLSSNELAD